MSRATSIPSAIPCYVVDDDDDDIQIVGVNNLNPQASSGLKLGEYHLDAGTVDMTPRAVYFNADCDPRYFADQFHAHASQQGPEIDAMAPVITIGESASPNPDLVNPQPPSDRRSVTAESGPASVSGSSLDGSESGSSLSGSESGSASDSSETQTVLSQHTSSNGPPAHNTEPNGPEWMGLAYKNLLGVLVGPKNCDVPDEPTKLPPVFFSDLANALVSNFPFEEFAAKHNCTVEDVNHALIANVIAPLIKCQSVDKGQMQAKADAIFDRWIPKTESQASAESTPIQTFAIKPEGDQQTIPEAAPQPLTPTYTPTHVPTTGPVEEQTSTYYDSSEDATYSDVSYEQQLHVQEEAAPTQDPNTQNNIDFDAQQTPISQEQDNFEVQHQVNVELQHHANVELQNEFQHGDMANPLSELTHEETMALAHNLLAGIAECTFGGDDSYEEQNVQTSPIPQVVQAAQAPQVPQATQAPLVSQAPDVTIEAPPSKSPVSPDNVRTPTPQSILKNSKRAHQTSDPEDQSPLAQKPRKLRQDTPRPTKKVRFDHWPPSPRTCAKRGLLPLPKLHMNPENSEKINKMKVPANPKPYVPLTDETRVKRHRVTVGPFGNYEEVSEYEEVDPGVTQFLLSQGLPIDQQPRKKRELTSRDHEKIKSVRKNLFNFVFELQGKHMDRMGLPRPPGPEEAIDEGDEEAEAPEDFYFDDEHYGQTEMMTIKLDHKKIVL
ncbi:uncharacterized protein GIQ15_05245 [Arthroderma uncinatum]|uniref:uncharacterized protein n=1 Tax=Arthroderma uncinatum TaxID=74035 RepID=UPI00144A6AAF|nr:uncharacterized protein GIQ15_05245 [Arthroderma uncinatum]KAF3482486.1 hypothetical protein GIQ15_05245 [Arthroderma uncinatum]